MDENLAGYLLKALDDDAQREVQTSLRESPELRSGVGSRSFLWGSVEIAKSFR